MRAKLFMLVCIFTSYSEYEQMVNEDRKKSLKQMMWQKVSVYFHRNGLSR